jgi:hypothetical protein
MRIAVFQSPTPSRRRPPPRSGQRVLWATDNNYLSSLSLTDCGRASGEERHPTVGEVDTPLYAKFSRLCRNLEAARSRTAGGSFLFRSVTLCTLWARVWKQSTSLTITGRVRHTGDATVAAYTKSMKQLSESMGQDFLELSAKFDCNWRTLRNKFDVCF